MMTAIAVRVRRTLLAGVTGMFALGLTGAGAQTTIDIGLMGPFSGPWAEHGQLMRIGAEMAIEDINKQGGIKSLGGAKLNLVVADTGPSIETTTNAAQRLLSQRALSAFMCCFLSSFSLAASEIGERQQVPMLTFSYSDELVRRGYKYIFRDSSGADIQVRAAIKLLQGQAAANGRKIESAALIADGYHARTDGLTSLAVVGGAAGVWLGYPLADPIVGVLITTAIFGIVWQSAKAVFTRLLDGVDPAVIEEIRHAATHVGAVKEVRNVRARWLGHRLTTELDVAVDNGKTVQEADLISSEVEEMVSDHVPALASANVRVRSFEGAVVSGMSGHARHNHAPGSVSVKGASLRGILQIVDTPNGERLRLTARMLSDHAEVFVTINRAAGDERLSLCPRGGERGVFLSTNAPEEPHEFTALLVVRLGEDEEAVPFRMREPADHVH